MARTQQFIGLTKAAEAFVAECEPLMPGREASVWGEGFTLRRWRMHPVLSRGIDCPMKIRERIQFAAWSSGPMIFTYLELDWGNGSKSKAFKWVEDPTLSLAFEQEGADREYGFDEHGNRRVTILLGPGYDKEKGTVWV